jgi:photosynthetic reaction center cytochrome c subunit
VNCTYCHNTRSFAAWDASTPQRATAWYGIRMVRALNDNYLDPLASTFPANRHGPEGDGPKLNCATCHQGAFKPLYGAAMAKDYPELQGVSTAAQPVAPVPDAATANATAVLSDLIAKIYFDTGKTAITPEGMKAVSDAAGVIKGHAGLTVALSGFADKTGNADANLELAKQRAMAVRDALQGDGVDASHISLKKPEFAIGGAEAEARRVDIVAVP